MTYNFVPLQFDYAKIGELLFQIGKAKHMRSDRRKRLYAVMKKCVSNSISLSSIIAVDCRFNMAANGLDPMSMELNEQDDDSDIDDDEVFFIVWPL